MMHQLSEDVRSHLRSGVAITSVTQCTEELVMNALDADATCVAVRVDLPCFKIQVVDNGQGMTREQLGRVGERYSTSKLQELEDLNNLQYFGYRGEAVASIRDTAAVLEINSRTSQTHQTYCRMFKKGESLPVTESAVQRPSVGTTVTVHDLFYSLPVRRKAINEPLELERIRYRVEGIALIHPSVSITLRNDVTGHLLLQTKKSSSILMSFTHLFGVGKAKSLREVSIQKDSFSVDGYIGKEGHSNKNLQFVFVNNRLVLKTRIHKILNHVLARSLVLKKKGSNFETSVSKTQTDEPQASSPPKQGEKYAMFVLNVKCPLDVYDITFDPAKTLVEFKDWSVLTNAIDEMVMNFLRKENLLSLSDTSSVSPAAPTSDDVNEEQNTGDKDSESRSATSLSNNINQSDFVRKGENYTDSISTQNTTNCLFSKMVRRPHVPILSFDQDDDGCDIEDDADNDGSGSDRLKAIGSSTEALPCETLNQDTKAITTPEHNRSKVESPKEYPANTNDSTDVSAVDDTDISHQSMVSECSSSTPLTFKKIDESSGNVSGSSIYSVESVTDSDSEQSFTKVQDPCTKSLHMYASENPFPITMRTKNPDCNPVSTNSNKPRTEKKSVICLPDPAPTPLGAQRLQNLKLIASKPHSSSAAQVISKRLGLTTLNPLEKQPHKSAAQKISDRLGLKEKKIISARLEKFKSTNTFSKQSSHSDTETISTKITNTQKEENISQISHPSLLNCAGDNKTVIAQSGGQTVIEQTDKNENNIYPITSTLSSNTVSVRTSSGADKDPIVPTIADIDLLTSKVQSSVRKRFNPFALSTSSKLAKLARKADPCNQDTSSSKPKEFLSTVTMLETAESVFGERGGIDNNHDFQRADNLHDEVDEPSEIDEEQNQVRDYPPPLANVEESCKLPEDPSCLLPSVSREDKQRDSVSPSVLPFTAYSDTDTIKDMDRVMNMDMSEAESVDSVVLPHIDCFSPVMSDASTGSADSPTQAFQSSFLQSQGFSSVLRFSDDDCQSGGFSPGSIENIESPYKSAVNACDRSEHLNSSNSVRSDLPFSSTGHRSDPETINSEKEQLNVSENMVETDRLDLFSTISEENSGKIHSSEAFHSESGSIEDSSSIACGQYQYLDTCRQAVNETENGDSFPLRKLLPEDSEEMDIQAYITHSDENQNLTVSRTQPDSDVTIEDQNGAEIDPVLAKEFEYDMSDKISDSKISFSDADVPDNKTCNGVTEGSARKTDCDERHRDGGKSENVFSYKEQPCCSSFGMDSMDSKPTWSSVIDPRTGKKIYVNSATGHTLYEEQWRDCGYTEENEEEEEEEKEIKQSEGRSSLVPLSPSGREKLHHMLNSHLVADNADKVKWRQPPTCSQSITSTASDGTNSIQDLFSTWDNPVQDIPPQSCINAEVSHISRAASQSHQTLYPTKFTKSMLKTVKVLGQVDNKFIACVLNTNERNPAQAPDLIVLFDQHAAHERVRLEQLCDDIYIDSDDTTDCCIRQSNVFPPKTLTFPEEEVRLIKSFRDEFKRIGIVFSVSGSSRDSLNIHTVPACLVEREANEVKRGRDSVALNIAENLIKEHLEMLRATGGARNRLPSAIHKVLCSQACHGAIKFGDCLSIKQCEDLLESLSHCDLPFQCAHGRPSIMPLLGLEQLKTKIPPERVKRPSLWKISKNLPIHQ